MFSKFSGAFRAPVINNNEPRFVVDQFTASDFFKEDGMELRDYEVFAKSQADPELKEKVREYLIENDIKGFDPGVSDDDVFASISSKYDTITNVLSRVKAKISELRAKPVTPQE